MFWSLYWLLSAGAALLTFVLGVLVIEFLPYSSDLGYGFWASSFVLLIGAGYGALSIVIAEEASKRGYSLKRFFWLSMGLTPILIGLIVPNLPRRVKTELVLQRICIKCQNPLVSEAMFCSVCGQLSQLVALTSNLDVNSDDGKFLNPSKQSPRIGNITGGSAALLGAITLISLFVIDVNQNSGSDFFGINGFVPLATSGAGLAILGAILLIRGLRAPKK